MNLKSAELLILLNLGHLAADYTWLSRPWMLAAKKFGTPLYPILIHAMVHYGVTAFILFFFCFPGHPALWVALSMFQWGTHFIIDVCKGRLNKAYKPFQDNTTYAHWTLFGSDQFLHQVVLILTVYFMNL